LFIDKAEPTILFLIIPVKSEMGAIQMVDTFLPMSLANNQPHRGQRSVENKSADVPCRQVRYFYRLVNSALPVFDIKNKPLFQSLEYIVCEVLHLTAQNGRQFLFYRPFAPKGAATT